jgi:hypothetical protein
MADLPIVTVQGRNFPNIFAQLRQTVIDDIPVKVSLEQMHSDRLEVSKHPIQNGAPISDHAYKVPPGLRLRCGWSNSDIEAAEAIVFGLTQGGNQSVSSYIDGIYTQLQDLQNRLDVFDVITIRRKYKNMLMVDLNLVTDPKTAQAIMVELSFEQIIIVDTQDSQLPAMADQANPADTAEVQDTGIQNTKAATPAPGGSLPPSGWAPKDAVSVTAPDFGVSVGSGLGGGS